jgi:hypothetical protein
LTVIALQGREGSEASLMTASNQIYLSWMRGRRSLPFTVKRDMQIYLRRRFDTFANPLVYTFPGSHGPSIMSMSSALAE